MSTAIRFGTDGWRGVIADEFTFNNLRRVSQATAEYIKATTGSNFPVLIGYDRRFLSFEFALCVSNVLVAAGLKVQMTDRAVTTPSVSVALKHYGYPWGIMLTASHNPASYNGFKIKEGSGRSAPPEVTIAIEQRMRNDPPPVPAVTPVPSLNWLDIYKQKLKSNLDWSALKKMRGAVAFDYLYGSASNIPEQLLKGLSLKVHALHAEHDPLFGGLNPEPIEEQLTDLKKDVLKTKAKLGIALDGDGDRLGVVDDLGRYLPPHQVFPLLALHGIEHKGWKGKIVQSVSLGALGPRIADHFGLSFEEVPVGFKHIADRMLKEPVSAGGEESGGYAFEGYGIPERDGILCGLMLLEMIAVTGKKLSRLVSDMEKRFGAARFQRIDIQTHKPIWDKATFAKGISGRLPSALLEKKISEVRTMDGVKIVREDGSWVLLRPSGTEPLIRTYAESSSHQETTRLLSWAQDFLRA